MWIPGTTGLCGALLAVEIYVNQLVGIWIVLDLISQTLAVAARGRQEAIVFIGGFVGIRIPAVIGVCI